MIWLLFHASFLGYLAATFLAILYLIRRGERVHRWCVGVAWTAWGVHTVALLAQLLLKGRLPLSNLHEASALVIWGGILLYLLA